MKINGCLFCNRSDIKTFDEGFDSNISYQCPVCGHVKMTEEAAEDFAGENFSKEKRLVLSSISRNHFENRGKKPPIEPYTLDGMHRDIEQYNVLDPIEKMDKALLNLEKKSARVAERINVPIMEDFTYYHCSDQRELHAILSLLVEQGYIQAQDPPNPHKKLWISVKGYEKIRELKKVNQQSNSCFVAMWFNPNEMGEVYEKAIRPAIEYKEDGNSESRFKAIKIDNVEHINDINDEIIAAIRRSRFVVCDLTGYRGGVYFEAGFAYGLGIPVIYTCRKDWCSEDKLQDTNGQIIEALKDSSGRDIRVRKEGVHFDLAHRNRIEWVDENLEEYKIKLQNRIKAVII